MRDWSKTLRHASFRGVSFWVEADDFAGGKRIARHEYAGGRRTYLEEMGLATAGYEVTAYLLGDAADVQAKQLAAACLASGPGRLVLPIDGGQMAYIEQFRRLRERDRMGYVAFGFSAVPLSNEAGASISVANVVIAVSTGIAAAARSFARLF